MSKKNLTPGLNPLAGLGKSSKKGGNKASIKQFDDFIAKDESDISIEPSSQQVQPRRLKKMKKANQAQKQKIIEKKQVLQQKSQSQYEQKQQSEELAENQYERFGRVDDQGLKKLQEQKNNKKGKKKIKKGQQQIDKFVQQHHVQQIKKTNPVKPKSHTQLSLQAMFLSSSQSKKVQQNNKSTKMQQQNNKKSDSDSDSNEDPQQAYRKRQAMITAQMKTGLTDQQILRRAIEQSLKQIQPKQTKHIPLESYSFDKNKNTANDPIKKNIQKVEQPLKKQTKQTKQPKKQQRKRSKSKSQQKKKTDKLQKKGQLAGLAIVTTGQFQPYSKNQILQLLQKLGADLPKSITKKTTHLLQGCFVINSFGRRTDQDVRTTTKSQQASQKNVQIIPFENLDDFFIEKTGRSLEELMEKDKSKPLTSIQRFVQIKKNQSAAKTIANQEEQMLEQQPHQHQKHYNNVSLPWTQKYKPKSSQQIIGQTSQLKSLKQWIQVWQDIHIHGNKRDVKPNFNTFMPSGTINSNAALLSGDAGLGKTTAARLIAAQFGYSIIQYNASDARNKKSVELISMGKNNMSFLANKQKDISKSLIIMDQVDGMSSGDRGGITAIIDMIKKTKVPIICICNDRQATKIRSLAGHCYDIKFHKPDKRMIAKRLQKIIGNEGGTATMIALENLVQILNNDIRQILTYLEVIFKSGTKNITSQIIQRRCTQKDSSLSVNHFEATKMLLTRTIFRGMKISQRIEMGFVDSDMVPLMIQQNYLNACQKKKMNSKQFKKLAKATQGFVISDMMDRSIMRNQNYCLMTNKMFLSCVYPCELTCEAMGFPKFTQWLGKFSSERKNRRLIKQLKYTIACTTPVTILSVKNHYVPMLLERISMMLKNPDPDIDSIVQFMWHYNLTPAILSQHLSLLQYGQRQQLLKNIQTSKKTKLTKLYNKKCETTKFKKQKIKATTGQSHLKFDPVLEQMQVQNVDQPEEQQGQKDEQLSGLQIQEKKGAKSKPKPKTANQKKK